MKLLYRSVVIVSFIIPFLFGQLRAQNNAFLDAKLVDSKSGVVIPFATVKLKNKSIGVISNTDGYFKFPVSYREAGNVLEISCIGYITKSVSLKELLVGQLNVIRLQEATRELGEVVIKAKKQKEYAAYRIVEMALERIPQNYPEKPYSYTGYYRDYQWKDKGYINLNEALVEVYDSGFQSVDQLATHIRLYEYKMNMEFPRDTVTETPYDNKPAAFNKGKNKYIPDAVLPPFGGNELSILRVHDAIRNNEEVSYSFVNRMNKDFVNNHFFTLIGDAYLNKTPLYLIEFKSKLSVTGPSHYASGKIYIQKSNFAIHKLKYTMHQKTMKEDRNMYDIQVEYSRTDSLMYLNYISFNNFFKVRNEMDYRIISLSYDRGLNAFVLYVNNTPEASSSQNKRNYEFTFGGVPLEIKMIEMEAREKKIYIYLSDEEKNRFLTNQKAIDEQLRFVGKNLRDVDNRELDAITYTAVNQFRELFVQKLNPTSVNPTKSDLFIRPDLPLSHNIVSPVEGEQAGHWMNSPLKENK